MLRGSQLIVVLHHSHTGTLASTNEPRQRRRREVTEDGSAALHLHGEGIIVGSDDCCRAQSTRHQGRYECIRERAIRGSKAESQPRQLPTSPTGEYLIVHARIQAHIGRNWSL